MSKMMKTPDHNESIAEVSDDDDGIFHWTRDAADEASSTRSETPDYQERDPEAAIRTWVPKKLAMVCFTLNILCPGLGTFVVSITLGCCSTNLDWSHEKKRKLALYGMFIALTQLITVVFLFAGWIWSCIWGARLMAEANAKVEDNPVPMETVTSSNVEVRVER